ncbi:MAG: hypothetical protein ABWW70_07020 [Thermoproteota archaeon]
MFLVARVIADEAEIVSKISELREEIKKLKMERYSIIAELRQLRAERRERVSRLRDLRSRLKELRDKRRALVERVKSLREERRNLLSRIRVVAGEVDEIRRSTSGFGRQSERRISALRRRIGELEWRLQTQVLSTEQERAIVEEIMRLEAELEKALEALRHREVLAEKRAELVSLRLNLRELSKEISKISNNISMIDQELGSIRTEIERLSGEVSEVDKKIEELSSRIKTIDEQIASLAQSLSELTSALREIRLGRERQRIEDLFRKQRKAVEEKLKRGEPLTIEELKVLYSNSPDELESSEDLK